MKTKILNVAICGAPNAGKSTFLNKMVGEKISIVSPKVQTTRSAINGIVNFEETQIVFTDTPGIFRARKDFSLEKRITNFAWKVVRASSVVLMLVDGFKGVSKEVVDILTDFKKRGKTVVVAITKIDRLSEEQRLMIGQNLESEGDVIEAIFYISSVSGDGIPKLTEFLKKKASEGDWIYGDDVVSDISESLTVAEIVREQIFLVLKDEIPYHTSVQTEKFEETDEGILASVLVTVTKESQKIIMIGKRGEMLKKIKHNAELELFKIFQKPVEARLFIRVRDSWREGEEYYNYLKI
jgi:GTP-binding protein Era